MSKMVTYIENVGGCVVSKNILSNRGKLRWCVREKSINDIDNGWRFFSDIDSEEYLTNPDNMSICGFNTVANIEPAILAIYNLPVGTDIELNQVSKVVPIFKEWSKDYHQLVQMENQ